MGIAKVLIKPDDKMRDRFATVRGDFEGIFTPANENRINHKDIPAERLAENIVLTTNYQKEVAAYLADLGQYLIHVANGGGNKQSILDTALACQEGAADLYNHAKLLRDFVSSPLVIRQ